MKHSNKSREKLADALMSLSTSSAVALFVSVLATPLGTVLAAMFKGDYADIWGVVNGLPPSTTAVFVVMYVGGVAAVLGARAAAMKIYDELYPER